MLEKGRERAVNAIRWIATRRPRVYLVAGWVAFVLGCYPGYLSVDSVLQLYTVRTGEFSDYAPVMTSVWSLLEYVMAGPFPMLLLQSGLVLFGAFAILRTVLAPRAAAVTAACVLLFPPVFSTFAVIWPEPLMAGALVAAVGAALQPSARWRAGALGFAILAVACRVEAALILPALAFIAIPPGTRWRRAATAIALAAGIAAVALVADRLATVKDTYVREQQLEMMDIVGTLRRAKVKDEAALQRAVAGMPLADAASLRERMTAANDASSWWSLAHGDKRIFELVDSDEEADATSAAYRRAITVHPGAYLTHRWAMLRGLLALRGKWNPVFDELGNPDLLAPLHHRATPSDWQLGMQAVVRAVGKTPLFRPWLYIIAAIAAIALARRRPVLRNLAVSGVVFELVMAIFAPSADYRYSHYLVCTVCIVLAALLVERRAAWRADG